VQGVAGEQRAVEGSLAADVAAHEGGEGGREGGHRRAGGDAADESHECEESVAEGGGGLQAGRVDEYLSLGFKEDDAGLLQPVKGLQVQRQVVERSVQIRKRDAEYGGADGEPSEDKTE
jgi:hypothetical protein